MPDFMSTVRSRSLKVQCKYSAPYFVLSRGGWEGALIGSWALIRAFTVCLFTVLCCSKGPATK